MRIQFLANDAGGFDDDYALSCGVSGVDDNGEEHYLGFDRLNEVVASEDPEEDWGVHFECDDQSNGAYNVLQSVRLTRELLTIDLNRQLGNLKGVLGFDVPLAIDDSSYLEFESFLTRIMRGMPEVYQCQDTV